MVEIDTHHLHGLPPRAIATNFGVGQESVADRYDEHHDHESRERSQQEVGASAPVDRAHPSREVGRPPIRREHREQHTDGHDPVAAHEQKTEKPADERQSAPADRIAPHPLAHRTGHGEGGASHRDARRIHRAGHEHRHRCEAEQEPDERPPTTAGQQRGGHRNEGRAHEGQPYPHGIRAEFSRGEHGWHRSHCVEERRIVTGLGGYFGAVGAPRVARAVGGDGAVELEAFGGVHGQTIGLVGRCEIEVREALGARHVRRFVG